MHYLHFYVRMQLKFSADNSTHSVPDAAICTAQVVIARIGKEAEAIRTKRSVLTKRTRPAAAVRAGVAEIVIVAKACGWKKDRFAVSTSDFTSFYTVLRYPSPGTFVFKFFKLFTCRHTPLVAPVGSSGIVRRFKG